MFFPEIWITFVAVNDWTAPWLLVGQFARAAGFLFLVGYYRNWSWWPQGPAERQLWAVWGGYLVACFTLGLSNLHVFGLEAAKLELRFYPGFAAVTALAFFALAPNFWGYCAAIGLAFVALAFVMAANVLWAPLEFGALWALVLILIGTRLRRLGKPDTPHT
jgi:hypothetical protein